MALRNFLTEIADAIRSKDGTTAPIPATDFASRIGAISTVSDNMAIVPEPCTVTIEFKESTSKAWDWSYVASISYVGVDETNTVCLMSEDKITSPRTIECLPFLVNAYVAGGFNGCYIDSIECKDADGNESYDVAVFDIVGEYAYGYIHDDCHIIVHYTVI